MDIKEFREKAEKMNYTKEEIDEYIEVYEDMRKADIEFDLKELLIEKPIF
jgi:hypothetical protein